MRKSPLQTARSFFEANILRPPGDGCWEWQGKPNYHGYGRIACGGGQRALVHRYAYEQFNGQIPAGMDIDHTCHNLDAACPGGRCAHRLCVNPNHLEAVPPLVNRLRSPRHHINRTHCPRGHEYSEPNTYRDGHGRRCRECAREADRSPRRVERQRERRRRHSSNRLREAS